MFRLSMLLFVLLISGLLCNSLENSNSIKEKMQEQVYDNTVSKSDTITDPVASNDCSIKLDNPFVNVKAISFPHSRGKIVVDIFVDENKQIEAIQVIYILIYEKQNDQIIYEASGKNINYNNPQIGLITKEVDNKVKEGNLKCRQTNVSTKLRILLRLNIE